MAETKTVVVSAALALSSMVASGASAHGDGPACQGLPGWGSLRWALTTALNGPVGGFSLNMWATLVDRDGIVCQVAFTGNERGEQWPGSRVISAQKANTANAFSLPKLALSTANLYSAVQPGGSLYGLQHSNPVDTQNAYRLPSKNYGTASDPLRGFKIGGVNVFGGGLALYNSSGKLVGAIGVSGDTSCEDHMVAWRARQALQLDYVPGGVSGDPNRPDNIVYDITPASSYTVIGKSKSGWGHPECVNTAPPSSLPAVRKPAS
ncbi:MAG: heme-binding protein [Betaproteobacteria bacterium]|nr:heme-binding protein [Betaproteobacteria bacterium]